MTVYLDCNATSPMEPAVAEVVQQYLLEEYGNAGSRTHEFGLRAKDAVQVARSDVADVVGASPEEVVFTSGATEANNLALLGLAEAAEGAGRRHIITSTIEHKAVLEPLEVLTQRGFEVDLISPTPGGWIDPDDVAARLRPDTFAVTVMHANNETGILQPLQEIADTLADHDAYFHTDAAQGFGKELDALRNPRIDLISVSAHKLYGPKGVGALIARRRGYHRPPLRPLMFGGGQEHGLRPGTLPVALIAGLGMAARIATRDAATRAETNRHYGKQLRDALDLLGARVHGDSDRCLPHVLNASVPGVDGEAALLATKGLVAISNGSACTSHSYEPSHVLTAMGLPDEAIAGALRFSWCHMTPDFDVDELVERLTAVRIAA
jgi:cysteine desulfurase